MQLKAVIFDFDGTLTKPGSIDFISIRKRIQCPEDQRLLEYINNLNDQLKKDVFRIKRQKYAVFYYLIKY